MAASGAPLPPPQLSEKALVSLCDSNWLNSDAINGLLAILAHYADTEDCSSAPGGVRYMNSFFYTKLQAKDGLVARWTMKNPLVGCKRLVIPLHLDGNHWAGTFVDIEHATIYVYDSLYRRGDWDIITRNICVWLANEGRGDAALKKPLIPELNNLRYWERVELNLAPRQPNYTDCGVHVLAMAWVFMLMPEDIKTSRYFCSGSLLRVWLQRLQNSPEIGPPMEAVAQSDSKKTIVLDVY